MTTSLPGRTIARRLVAVLVGVLVLVGLGACGDDGGSGAGSGSGQAADLAERADLEAPAVAEALCDGWALDRPDAPTINEYVHDLLRPLDRVNSPNPPTYTNERIDELVVAGCRDHADDPERLVASVRDGLGLTEADLDELVDDACGRYRVQQERMSRGNWSGEDLSDFIRGFFADRGAGLAKLRAAVEGVCVG